MNLTVLSWPARMRVGTRVTDNTHIGQCFTCSLSPENVSIFSLSLSLSLSLSRLLFEKPVLLTAGHWYTAVALVASPSGASSDAGSSGQREMVGPERCAYT